MIRPLDKKRKLETSGDNPQSGIDGDSPAAALNTPAIEDDFSSLMQFILNRSQNMVSVVDHEYRYRMVNEAYVGIYRRPMKQIVGLTVAEVWGAEKFDSTIQSRFDRCFDGETINESAWIDCGPAGRRFMDILYLPYREKDFVSKAIVIAHDITDLKLAEQTLRESENRYRLLFENSMDLVLTTDLDGDVTMLNPAAEKVFRPGKNILMQVQPDDIERMRRALDSVVRGSSIRDLELRVLDREGRPRHLAMSATGLIDARGECMGCSAIARDITHRRRFETMVRDAGLSAREKEILKLVANGYTNLNIASRLGIQESTVKFHLNRIFRKTRTQNRTELTALLGNDPRDTE